MLQKLSIMLLNSAPKITYYAFKRMPIILKIMPLSLNNFVILKLLGVQELCWNNSGNNDGAKET